ncbi:MAG: hypothetical protein HYZ49_15020 [Chloroflexi bacterium]|nr:hypothetical protein [Chloroflexota bacterium]
MIPSIPFAKSSVRLLRSLALFSSLKDDELDDLVTRDRNLLKTLPGGFVAILSPQALKELAES